MKRGPGLRWLGLLALYACLAPPGAGAATDAVAAAAEARAWLSRIYAAANHGNYQGTMVFSVGGTMSSSRVWHYVVGDQTYEQLEALDGRQQRIVRHNEDVHTLWPQARVAVVEKRETMAAWSTTPQAIDPQAAEQYELRREGEGRVAGRPTTIFLLQPRDLLRYAQRVWADQASGLMLRADVLGLPTAGAPRPVIESTAFSEVAIGVRPHPDAVMQAMLNPRRPEGYRVLRPQQQRTSLEAEGWTLANPVPGFRLAGCLRRGMENAGDDEPVLQAVFGDGLTHVSLFVETFKPDRHRGELQAQHGATATLMVRRANYWVTAVGDVPATTLRLFVAALERRQP